MDVFIYSRHILVCTTLVIISQTSRTGFAESDFQLDECASRIVQELHTNPNECTIDELRELSIRETFFDYCGIAPESEMRKDQVGAPEQQFRILTKMGLGCYPFRVTFLEHVVALEACAAKGDRAGFTNAAAAVTAELQALRQDKGADRQNRRRLEMGLQRCLYSLARLIPKGGSGCMVTDDLAIILPDCLFEENGKVRNASKARLLVFRDMIAAGCAIEDFRIKNGCLPERIEDIAQPYSLSVERYLRLKKGPRLSYRTNGDKWELFFSTDNVPIERFPFNEYVPALSGTPLDFWSNGNRLWLSSDYSKKRMELYQTGELRGEKGAICRMVDGMICKP